MKITIYDHRLKLKKVRDNSNTFVEISSINMRPSKFEDGASFTISHDVEIDIFDILRLLFKRKLVIGTVEI